MTTASVTALVTDGTTLEAALVGEPAPAMETTATSPAVAG
jgi:hypothetical protein